MTSNIVNWLTGIASILVIAVISLFLTGHLVIEPQFQITNLVDDNGQVILQLSKEVTSYKIVFQK